MPASFQGTQTRSGPLLHATSGWVTYQFGDGRWAGHQLEFDTVWPFPTSGLTVAFVRAELLQQVDPDAGWRTSMTTRGLRVSCRPRFARK